MFTIRNKRVFSFVLVGFGCFFIGCIATYLFIQTNIFNEKEENNWFLLSDEEIFGEEWTTQANETIDIHQVKLVVDVKGAVKMPGVYELEEGKRVIDAIEAAGGITDDANENSLNYAQKLFDEMVVYVPSLSENDDDDLSTIIHSNVASTSHLDGSGKVNVNAATIDELTTLPGIGPAKGEAIIKYREENGPFQTMEDLLNVPGIGEKTLETMRDLVDVK